MYVRFLMILVLSSLVITAVVAVATLIFGEFDDTAAKILGTSASVAGCSLLAMAGAAPFGWVTSRLTRTAGAATIVCALVAFVCVLLLIWVDAFREEPLVKACGISSMTAASLAVVVLLAKVRLPASRQWLRSVTVVLIVTLAALVDVPIILFEVESDAMGRAVGVVGVLMALGILTTPVVAWQAARESRQASVTPISPAGTVRLTCPSCGTEQDVAIGRSRCTNCRQGIAISLFQNDETT